MENKKIVSIHITYMHIYFKFFFCGEAVFWVSNIFPESSHSLVNDCVSSALKLFRAVKFLSYTLYQGNNCMDQLFLERSKQTGRMDTRAICQRQSQRCMFLLLSSSFKLCQLTQPFFQAQSVMFSVGQNELKSTVGRQHLKGLKSRGLTSPAERHQISLSGEPQNWAQVKVLWIQSF